MNVKELIEYLSTLPQDMPVKVVKVQVKAYYTEGVYEDLDTEVLGNSMVTHDTLYLGET